MEVESFSLDHTRVRAPFVRKCCTMTGEKGDMVTKFDLRFSQPNKDEMQSAGIHTLEHLMAGKMRDFLPDIIDISPMGCRTGFYMTVWGDPDLKEVIAALEKSLEFVLEAQDIPAANEIQCGNFRLHSLVQAKEYAKKVLDAGIKDTFMDSNL